MIKKIAFLTLGIIALPQFSWAAPCSRINLTKCLDSACAINLSANPAARCQYCGTADAGTAPSGMKTISAGASSKNTISAKELKNAPTDPGERYVWATNLCLTKVQNCTADDVSETYDPLIEKSCTAAGIASGMASAQKKAAKNTKNASTCKDDILNCVIATNKCDNDFSKCPDDEKFDQFFATCSAQAAGCTNFVDSARSEIATSRTATLKTAKSNITAIAVAHKRARLNKISEISSKCINDKSYNACIEVTCANNTEHNCSEKYDEQKIAIALCEFYKTACNKVQVLTEREIEKSLDDLMQEVQRDMNL